MIKLIFVIILLLNSSFIHSQSFDYSNFGLGCSPSAVYCLASRDVSTKNNITMHVENIDDDKLVLKTNHKDLNPDGLKLFLGDQIENLEKGVEYKFILVEDYVFSDEETNSYRIKEGLTIPKGEYLVYFDEQNIYLKYKLR